MKKSEVTLNRKQKVYVIPCGGGGYSCLGFDVLEIRAEKLAGELGHTWTRKNYATMAAYEVYQKLVNEARDRNAGSGWRSSSELTPQLMGLEGRRVEVVDSYGERRRFQVGKSTGFIPCHLEVARRTSTGGGGVTGAPFKSIRIVV